MRINRILTIVFLGLICFSTFVSAVSVTIKATRYKLRIYNGTQDAGAKYDTSSTTAVAAGMYARYSTYSAEVLCAFSLSAIPAGATINSVSFGYNVSTRTAATHPVKIFKVSKSWSGTPQYNTFGTTAWPAADSMVSENCTATGWRTLTHARLKTLVDGWIANPATNYGVVITDDPRYYRDTINVIGARLVVDYTLSNPPKLAITANPTSGIVPLAVNFTATNTGGPVTTWAWTFGDGGTAAAQNASHTYTAAGTYTAKLKATGSGGSDSQTVVITVNPAKPNLSLTANPTSGMVPLTTNFTVTNSGGPVTTWNWSFGDGTTGSTQNPSHTYVHPGSYNAQVIASGTGGSDTEKVTITAAISPRYQDSLALVALYDSTDGANWNTKTNWLTVAPLELWFGIFIISNRVDSIDLTGNNLSGNLPSSIGLLTELTSLVLSGNLLTGQIPEELFSLTQLKKLKLFGNRFTGNLSPSIGNLVNADTISLGGNEFSYSIPVTIGNCVKVKFLDLGACHFEGQIPSTLANCTELRWLHLPWNNLTGTIPSSFVSLNKIIGLYANNNNLSGPVPSVLFGLDSLLGFQGDNNNFSGEIPAEILNDHKNTLYSFNSNHITGVPEGVIHTNVSLGLRGNNLCTLSSVALKEWLSSKDDGWSSTQTCLPPEIQVTAAPTNGMVPLTVNFSATNIGQSNIDTWSWTFGDGATSAQQNPQHTYTTADTFTAVAIGSGIGGSDTQTIIITTYRPPEVHASATPLSGPRPLSVTFSASNIGGTADTWNWNFGDGTTSSAQNPPPHTYTDAGTYRAVVSATNAAGTSRDSVIITVNPALYSLTLQTSGSGSTNPPAGTVQVEEGTDFPISATPGPRSHFVNWSVVTGSATVADPASVSTTVRLAGNAVIQANFEVDQDGRWQDSLALVALYNSMNGANWTNNTNWLTNQPIESWYGITVYADRVIDITLNENNLSGRIPSIINSISRLIILSLRNNNLIGQIPNEIYTLSELQCLILSSNQLDDTLSSAIGNLTKLLMLDIKYNRFTGQLPEALFTLTELVNLFINGNQFSGNLSESIGNLINMSSLDLFDNNFNGPIPQALGNCIALTRLNLSKNSFTGIIHSALGGLNKLEALDLSYNKLNGTFPRELATLQNLEEIGLRNNSFTDLPIEIAQNPSINVISVDSNSLCSLPLMLKQWLNAKNPSWYTTQSCPPPQFTISANPQSGSVPLTVNFTATNTGTGVIDTWLWNFGDGDTSIEQNPIHTYTTFGIFKAKLTATGIGGTASDSLTITVLPPPPAVTITATPQSGNAPLSVSFSVINTGGPILTYSWIFGDGATSSAQSPVHVYSTAGSYTVQVTVTGPGGSATANVLITVIPPLPVITASASPASGVIPLTVNFTATNTGGTVTDWQWNFGDGTTSTDQNPVHIYTSVGTYSARVIATGPGGLDTASVTVITRHPAPDVSVSANPTSGIVPLAVTFTATNAGGPVTTWSWNFGDGSSSTLQNPSHTYTSTGTFRALLTAAGAGGTDTASAAITVNPAAPVVRITATPTSGPVPLNVTFTAANTGGPAASWLWEFGDGTTSTVQNPPVHTYSVVGTYRVRLAATNVSGTSRDSVLITVNPVMVALTMCTHGSGTTTPTGTVQVPQGSTNPITATPDRGYHFKLWAVEQGNATVANSSQSSTSVLVNTAARVCATFEPDTYSLAVVAGSHGTTTPSGTVAVLHGIPFAVSAEADNGYVFERWTATSGSATIQNPSSALTNVTLTNGNAEITASFIVDTTYVTNNKCLTITGTLSDSLGNPIGYPSPVQMDVDVRLVTRDTLGDTVYTERFYRLRGHKVRGVTVDNGYFAVRLGTGQTLDNLQAIVTAYDNLYVEITILGTTPDVLKPRIPLTSVPYTFTGPVSPYDMNVLHGFGNPNNKDIIGRVGLYYIDDETGSTWLRVNTGWKLVD